MSRGGLGRGKNDVMLLYKRYDGCGFTKKIASQHLAVVNEELKRVENVTNR
jgi:hypothetical protein